MDAQIVVSALIEKLQNESTIIHRYPVAGVQVETAINKLNLLKQRLKLAESLGASPTGDSMSEYDHGRRMVKLLQAVYSAENAADTLLTREAFELKTKVSGSKKRFRWPLATSMGSRHETRREMKTFEDEFREYLSSYDRMLEMTDIQEVVGNNNETESSSQQIDLKDQQSQSIVQQPRWGRISDRFCKEDEADVVGFEELKTKLVDLTVGGSSLRVIPVVGEGGSGKTALVRTVYNQLLAKRKLDRSAWVDVPSMFRARYVLSDILKQFTGISFVGDATVPDEELIEQLTEILEYQRCLIVIEDVESPQVLQALRRGVIHSKSSRTTIVITTHNEDVARYAARSILKVRRLNNEESWKLFLNKVQFAEGVLNKSDKLITLKEQILKVCDGSPLKIVLLGGLLSSKELSYDEWSRVIERANNLKGDILALSYQDLSPQVKPCFLYLGLFPRGFEIHIRRLIHLWVSEGFVTEPLHPAAETSIPEDLAEMYFEELVIRNMVQVKWRLDGSPKTCRMSGVLYDNFSPQAADLGFFHHQFHSSPDTQPKLEVRRLATRLGIKNDLGSSSFLHFENLRSYVAFDTRIPGKPAIEIGTLLNKIITDKGFGLLKILDLEGVYKPVLSDDVIGKFFLLSYLGLRSTAMDSLPSSAATLPCLETLDVKHTIIHDLPTSIWQAKKLRNLYLNWGCSSTNFRKSSIPSQPPNNLRTLWGLSVDEVEAEDGVGVLGFLKTLTGLRKLGLTCTSESTAKETAAWVSQLTKLQSLKLRSIRKESNGIFDLKLPNMKSHHELKDLYLLGGLSAARSWTDSEFPPNLRMLTLSGSGLSNDPMPMLGRLPHLHILRLFKGSYSGDIMTCSGGGFPELRVLKLWNLGIHEWRVEEGAMPCLRELEIRKCENLNPQRTTGLEHLTALKKVALIEIQTSAFLNFVRSQERDLYLYMYL